MQAPIETIIARLINTPTAAMAILLLRLFFLELVLKVPDSACAEDLVKD